MEQLRLIPACLLTILRRDAKIVDGSTYFHGELNGRLDTSLQIRRDGLVIELFGLVLDLGAELSAMDPDKRCLRARASDIIGHQGTLCRDRR